MFKFDEQFGGDIETAENNVPERNPGDDVCIHIFLTSATLIGVCLTIIGISRAVFYFKAIETVIDDLLAGDAMLFLAACLLSYVALRNRSAKRHRAIEKAADGIFLVALFLMAVTCCLITFTFI